MMLRPLADTDSDRSAVPLSDGALLDTSVTADGYHVARYRLSLESIPVDFFADPDGRWTFEGLAAAAGFAFAKGVAVGALAQPFRGHPDGAAVVTLNAETRPYVAIVECPVAYEVVSEAASTEPSAA